MLSRNTFVRALHDLGAGAWFGGSLMGALGVNGAAAAVRDPTDRARVATAGWRKWAPAHAVAIGAHLVGGGCLLLAQRDRVRDQAGVTANTLIKTAVTGAALVTTACSGVLGVRVGRGGGKPKQGATEPAWDALLEVTRVQRRLRMLQWATPVLTAAIIVLGAQQGEQERPAEILRGFGRKLARKAH